MLESSEPQTEWHSSYPPPPLPVRVLGVCIAGSSDDVYLSLGMRSLMLGLDSVAPRRSLARWAFLHVVPGEGGGACSTAVQRSSEYSCRFCRSFSMSGRRVKYGRADTPTTAGPPAGPGRSTL